MNLRTGKILKDMPDTVDEIDGWNEKDEELMLGILRELEMEVQCESLPWEKFTLRQKVGYDRLCVGLPKAEGVEMSVGERREEDEMLR